MEMTNFRIVAELGDDDVTAAASAAP